MIGCFNEAIKPLVSIMPKMSGYVKTFKVITSKLITYRNKVYINFCRLNVPQDDMECESFIVISIDSLFVYAKKYYIQVYLDNCVYKTVN